MPLLLDSIFVKSAGDFSIFVLLWQAMLPTQMLMIIQLGNFI
jgi:hypothetical protein